MDKNLNLFGELLMKEVRDTSIQEMDKIIDGKMKGEIAEKIQSELTQLEGNKEMLKKIIPSIIDRTLDSLLFCIEENPEIELLYNGENLVDLSDGLSGELYSDDGWIKKYSREREM